MKIRWTENSVRFRITPTELNALAAGSAISERLSLPGGAWSAEIVLGAAETTIDMDAAGHLRVKLAQSDLARLFNPAEDGVYFSCGSDTPLTYFIEKDFPCAHPRTEKISEVSTETFEPPMGFKSKED